MSNVLIGVTGGISAYKIPSVVSVLVDKGHDVRVIMTEAAKRFITPLTFSSLSHNPVYDDSKEFFGNDGHIWHVELAKWADVFAIAPMTANTGSKLISKITDNLLTSTVLAYHKNPILLFPAMNLHMWDTFKNSYLNSRYGAYLTFNPPLDVTEIDMSFDSFNPKLKSIMLQPATGKMACGDVGEGKLVDVKTIVSAIERMMKI